MNEVLKAIAARNSCRNFSSEPLTDEQISALVNAGLAAPSAVNRQPWHIIVVTDKALIEEMDKSAMEIFKESNQELYNRMMERGGSVFYNAPCIIYVAKDDSDWATLDCGIVTQNIALAAHSLGLGNVICGMANAPLNGPKGDDFKKRIKLPMGYSFGMSICIGKAISGKEPHELDPQKVTYVK